MLRKLVEKALSLRLAVLGIAVVLAGIGGWSFANLPIDAFPDISSTQVKIILKAPGMTPEEVESRVITPIEMEMLGIPNQSVLRSVAKYAIADITIDFADGTDIYWARSQVAERLNAVMGDLPDTVSGGMAPISTPLSDMYMFTLEGPQSLAEKRRVLDWIVRPALRTVPGVADVNALGGYVETFEVAPDNAALAAAGLSTADLVAAIEASNRNDGAGRLVVGEEALIVRSTGAIRTLDDLANTVVRSGSGAVLRVGDLAQVRTGSLTRYGAVTKDGKGEAVEGLVIGLRGADASKVVDGVKARLEEIKPSLPEGMSIKMFYDRSDLIGRAVGTVEEALARGDPARRGLAAALSRRRARLGDRRAGPADGGAADLHLHARHRPDRQSDEPRRSRHRGGHAGRRGRRRGRERGRAAERRKTRQGRQAAQHLHRHRRGGQAGRLGHGDHRTRLPSPAHAAGAGGQAFRAGREDHRAGASLRAPALAHPDPGARLFPAQGEARAPRAVVHAPGLAALRPACSMRRSAERSWFSASPASPWC